MVPGSQPADAEPVKKVHAEPVKKIAPVEHRAAAAAESVQKVSSAPVKKVVPVERRADNSQQLSERKEPRAQSWSGGLQGLIGFALGDMARISAKLRSIPAGGSDGASLVDAGRERKALRGIVEGTALKLEGLQERVFGEESGAVVPRGDAGRSALADRPHAVRRPSRSEADQSARKRLVEGATSGAAGGEGALDAAISEHEELPAHMASSTPDADPRRAFSRPRFHLTECIN